VPPVPEPPPPPTSRDFSRPAAAAPAAPRRPVQRPQPLPPRPVPPAQQRPPTDAPALVPAPLPGPNPADLTAGQGRQRNDYLSRLFRHLAPYRVYPPAARANNQHGRVVTRITIKRDGGLVDVRIDTSSGWPLLDQAELEAIRRGAPFPPVPANMPGDPVILILRMNY
jgi:protein TonB